MRRLASILSTLALLNAAGGCATTQPSQPASQQSYTADRGALTAPPIAGKVDTGGVVVGTGGPGRK